MGIQAHDQLLTVKEVGARLDLPYHKVRWLICYGKLRAL
jgi:hypothetical protein